MSIPELLSHLQACQADVRIEMQYGDAESLAKAQERVAEVRREIEESSGESRGRVIVPLASGSAVSYRQDCNVTASADSLTEGRGNCAGFHPGPVREAVPPEPVKRTIENDAEVAC